MNVIACSTETIEEFFGFPDSSGLKAGVIPLFKQGISDPQWCFLLSSGSMLLGRAGYMKKHASSHEFLIFGLLLPQDSYISSGEILLHRSLDHMKMFNIESVEYQLFSHEHPPEAEKLFTSLGLQLVQEKIRFEADLAKLPISRKRLRYVSFEEAGYRTYAEAVQEVTRGTLDRDDAEAVQQYGEEKAAEMYMETLLSMEDSPNAWLLAYQGDNLVGLVIPQVHGSSRGVINYIGIVPEFRGKGYGAELIVKALEFFQKQGCAEAAADIDSRNAPMKKILIETGFTQTTSILLFRKSFVKRKPL